MKKTLKDTLKNMVSLRNLQTFSEKTERSMKLYQMKIQQRDLKFLQQKFVNCSSKHVFQCVLTYILAAMIFWTYASTGIAMAKNLSTEEKQTKTITNIDADTATNTHTLLAAKTYKLPIIPKPSNLPGPEKEELEGQAKGARNLLSNEVMPKLAVMAIGFVGGVSLLMLIIGGVRFAMVYGTEENVEKAKKQVIYALVGFVIALLSYTIVAIISNLEYKGDTGKGAAKPPTEAEIKATLDAETEATLKELDKADAEIKTLQAEIDVNE